MTREEFNKMSLDDIYNHIQKIENTCINLATAKFSAGVIGIGINDQPIEVVTPRVTLLSSELDVPVTTEYVSPPSSFKESTKPNFYQDEDGNWQRSDRPKKDYTKKENPRYDANTTKGRTNKSTGERYITTYCTSAGNIHFRVAVVRDGKKHSVGSYKTLKDAIRARDLFLNLCEENQ